MLGEGAYRLAIEEGAVNRLRGGRSKGGGILSEEAVCEEAVFLSQVVSS